MIDSESIMDGLVCRLAMDVVGFLFVALVCFIWAMINERGELWNI